MDGENNGKHTIKMDDLGGKPTIFGNTHILSIHVGGNSWIQFFRRKVGFCHSVLVGVLIY